MPKSANGCVRSWNLPDGRWKSTSRKRWVIPFTTSSPNAATSSRRSSLPHITIRAFSQIMTPTKATHATRARRQRRRFWRGSIARTCSDPAGDTVPVWLVFFRCRRQRTHRRLGLDPRFTRLCGRKYPSNPQAVVIVDMIGDADLNIHYEMNSDKTIRAEIWEYRRQPWVWKMCSFKRKIQHAG
jgi:hypothetical protein